MFPSLQQHYGVHTSLKTQATEGVVADHGKSTFISNEVACVNYFRVRSVKDVKNALHLETRDTSDLPKLTDNAVKRALYCTPFEDKTLRTSLSFCPP